MIENEKCYAKKLQHTKEVSLEKLKLIDSFEVFFTR